MRNLCITLLFVSGPLLAFAACSGDGEGGAAPAGGDPSDAAAADGASNMTDSANNGTDGGAGDAAVPGYDVKSLPGLVLWLESETGVDLSQASTKWVDQSGNANDAVRPSSCGRPDRNAETLNGHDALGFHEFECLEIPDAVSLQWGTGDFYVGAVARNFANTATSATTGTTFTYQDGSFLRKRFGEVYSKIPSLFGPGPAIVFNDWTDRSRKIVGSLDSSQMVRVPNVYAEPAHLIGLRRKGTVIELRIDGTVASQVPDAGAPIDVSTVGTPIAIGGRPGLTNFVGSIWEIVAIKGAVGDAELATFEAYAKSKYTLPGPP